MWTSVILLCVDYTEFYREVAIAFVEYDERVYNYGKEGATLKKGTDEPNKAKDWYAFAESLW